MHQDYTNLISMKLLGNFEVFTCIRLVFVNIDIEGAGARIKVLAAHKQVWCIVNFNCTLVVSNPRWLQERHGDSPRWVHMNYCKRFVSNFQFEWLFFRTGQAEAVRYERCHPHLANRLSDHIIHLSGHIIWCQASKMSGVYGQRAICRSGQRGAY